MGLPVIQPSFAAGELAPSLWARVDLAKYHVGAALLRNFFVDYRGGAANRPGTEYVNTVKDSANTVRLIPFIFSTVQTYALEFGNLYMRVIMNGGHVLEPTTAITGATKANPCVITDVAHGYATGDWVFISGVGGMTQLNGKYYKIVVLTANTYSLQTLSGVAVDSSAYGVYTVGGTAARVFTLVTPYASADLALLKFTQSADTMTLVHPSYAPRNLTRTAHYVWTLTAITFAPTQAAPVLVSTVPSGVGATGYSYVVTAISADGTEESLPSNSLTAASVPMSTTAGSYITVTWAAPAGTQPSRYNIYRTDETVGLFPPPAGSIYGYAGSTDGTALTFVDQNVLEDLSNAPPTSRNPFAAGNNPGCSAYFQQRRLYAGSTSGPQTIWASRSFNFNNMNTTFPSKATDALTLSILSQQVNAIQHMIPLKDLIILTKGGAWKISSGGTGSEALSPTAVSADPQVYNGCNDRVPPIIVNYDILYVQAKGAIVRDLAYNLYLNVFTGTDLSVLSNHLFTGRQIVEWAWAEEPFKIIWCVRDDGKLLAFTYLKEQDVYAWTQHDTLNGVFESVTSIPEGTEDAVYFVVRRLINGQYVRYIERLASRNFNNGDTADVTQAFFVDAGLSYPQTMPNATVTLGFTTTSWAADNVAGGIIKVTASAGVFAPGDVGTCVRFNGGRATVSLYVSNTEVHATVIIPFTSRWPALTGAWTYTAPVSAITGLDHLEGETVSVLGDGGVQASKVVVNGRIPLDAACSDIAVGEPIQSQLQGLYIDTGATPTIQGKPISISACTLRVKDSRGLKVGTDFSLVVPIKERTRTTPLGTPMPLLTQDERIVMDPSYAVGSRVCVQQDDPLPAQVLGIIPEISVGK